VGPGGAQPVERTRAEVEATGHAFAVVLQPNPLRGGGAITLSMPRAGAATIEILDLAGRHVRDLMREAHIAAGVHRIEFDGRAADGAELSSGMYFYRVTTSEGKATRRFAILR
jgi:hypothetical protein